MNEIARTKNTNDLKSKVKSSHQILVREGKYSEARRVLQFLRYGSLTCGLGDVDWSVTLLLEKLGVRSITSSTGRCQDFYLN